MMLTAGPPLVARHRHDAAAALAAVDRHIAELDVDGAGAGRAVDPDAVADRVENLDPFETGRSCCRRCRSRPRGFGAAVPSSDSTVSCTHSLAAAGRREYDGWIEQISLNVAMVDQK